MKKSFLALLAGVFAASVFAQSTTAPTAAEMQAVNPVPQRTLQIKSVETKTAADVAANPAMQGKKIGHKKHTRMHKQHAKKAGKKMHKSTHKKHQRTAVRQKQRALRSPLAAPATANAQVNVTAADKQAGNPVPVKNVHANHGRIMGMDEVKSATQSAAKP